MVFISQSNSYNMLFICCILLSCSKDREADIPTFVEVSDVEVITTMGQGTSHQEISELYVYADNRLLGIFPVPSSIPVIGKQQVEIEFFAGIRENGISNNSTINPFFETLSLTVDLTQPQVVFVPVFGYRENAVFTLVESFESSHTLGVDLDQDEETFISVADGTNSIEGRFAIGSMTRDHAVLEVATNFVYDDLPDNGAPVYLEFQYKSDVTLAVGLRGHHPSESPLSLYKLGLFPSNEWKKIYVNFTADVQDLQRSGYQIIFLASYSDSNPKAVQSIYLDNLKLLHF